MSQDTFGVTQDRVTSVVVAVDSDAALLCRTLAAIAAQTILPSYVILAVPTAASVQSVIADPVVAQTLGNRLYVIPVGNTATFGEAVSAGLKRFTDEVSGAPVNPWLWLLHADCIPEPTALEELVLTGESSAKIGVVGPKQVRVRTNASEPYILQEIGIRATRSGRRVPDIHDGERDQGQYDFREDVLAVGSAGMLVRSELWARLGGYNPHLGPFGDGLEFSRRVWLAGYRVVVAPRAVIGHAATSLHAHSDLGRSFGARRYAQIFNALLASSPAALIPLWLGYILAAVPRALVRLMWRDPVRAKGEIVAGARTLGILGAVKTGREAIAHLRGNSRSLSRLEASSRDVREGKKAQRIAQIEESAPEYRDPLEVKAQRDLRMHTMRGAGITFLLALVFAVLVHVPHFSSGTLVGGALATDSSTAGTLLRAAFHGWLASGNGYPGVLDTFWLSFLPILLLGSPWGLTLGTAATVLLYVAIPVAALFAYLAAGRFTKSAVARTLCAVIWIVAPSLLEALASGRVAAVVVHMFLPLAIFAYVGAWRRSAPRAASDGGAQIGILALSCGLLATATPLYAVLACVAGLIGFVARPAARKRWLWVPIPTLALLAPSAATLELSWRAWIGFLFSQPGVPAAAPTSARSILSGFVSHDFAVLHPHLNWLLFIPLLVILACAVAALARGRVSFVVRASWLLVVTGMAVALIAAYVPVGVTTVDGLSAPVPGWYGVGFSLAWLGVFTAICAAANGLRVSVRSYGKKLVTAIAALLGALVVLSLVSVAGAWVYFSWTAEKQELYAQPELQVPAIARTHQESPAKSRVLVMNPTAHGYDVQVWRGNGLEMHEHSMSRSAVDAAAHYPLTRAGASVDAHVPPAFDSAHAHLASAIANITAASSDVVDVLAQHAISVILVPPATESTDIQAQSQLIAHLNAVPGIEFITTNAAGTFWRVPLQSIGATHEAKNTAIDAPARLTLVDTTGDSILTLSSETYSAHTPVSASSNERFLVLSERASSDWEARIDGTILERVSTSESAHAGLAPWAQVWKVPADMSGELDVLHMDWGHLALSLLYVIIVIIGLFVAMPLSSRKEDVA